MKKYLTLAMFVVLAVVLVSPISVSAKTKAGTKSGSFFYFFDKAFEKTDLFFTFSPEKKAMKALENAEERLAEAEESASENKPEAVTEAMKDYQKNIEILEKVLNKVPEEAKKAITKAIEANKERQEEMTKKIEEINNEIKKEDNDFKKDEEEKSNDDVGDNESGKEEVENENKDENKKDEQKKEIEKLEQKVETLKQKQIVSKQPTLETQNSQEQKKTEEVRNNAEETTKKLATENLQKEQEENKIKAKQEQPHEVQKMVEQKEAEEKQKELERQQQLENQRLAKEKVTTLIDRDITPPIISNIKTSIKLQSLPATGSIIIEWSTNEPTLDTVNFGGNMSCSINGCQDAYSSFGIFKQSESYELDHQIIIDRYLEPATEYKYYIYATDKTGNETGFYDGKIVTEPFVPLPELKGQYNTDLVLTKDKSPYTVTGDVFINKKLQIEPGVEIKFNGDHEIVVNEEFGVIKVNGTKNEPVLFKLNQSIDTSNRGILVRSNNDNIIDNAIIESGYNGISIDSGKNGKRAKVTISNSTIKNNVAVGIFVNNSDVKIINNKITQNRTGIQSVLNSITEISQNNISDNSFIALVFINGAIPQLKFNNIYGNNDIMRIHAHPDLAIATLSQNNISLETNKGYIYFGSEATSFWNSAKGQINAQNNWWDTEDVVIIKQRIKEYNDVSFNYQPIATSQFAEAGVQ